MPSDEMRQVLESAEQADYADDESPPDPRELIGDVAAFDRYVGAIAGRHLSEVADAHPDVGVGPLRDACLGSLPQAIDALEVFTYHRPAVWGAIIGHTSEQVVAGEITHIVDGSADTTDALKRLAYTCLQDAVRHRLENWFADV